MRASDGGLEIAANNIIGRYSLYVFNTYHWVISAALLQVANLSTSLSACTMWGTCPSGAENLCRGALIFSICTVDTYWLVKLSYSQSVHWILVSISKTLIFSICKYVLVKHKEHCTYTLYKKVYRCIEKPKYLLFGIFSFRTESKWLILRYRQNVWSST